MNLEKDSYSIMFYIYFTLIGDTRATNNHSLHNC